MNLYFKISFVLVCISAQNQACMDRCGKEVDACHASCSETRYCIEDEQHYRCRDCHNGCYSTMCRCFKGCGCPECCDHHFIAPNSHLQNNQIFADETFEESEKKEVSQFLRKKTIF